MVRIHLTIYCELPSRELTDKITAQISWQPIPSKVDLPDPNSEDMNAALGQSEMKRILLAPESTFDCSSSLFSTLNSGEISLIIKPNPPLKKLKTTNSTMTSVLSSSSDTIIGDIHPSNMDLDNLDDLSNPGSPLDRSTPISDYEMGVDEMG